MKSGQLPEAQTKTLVKSTNAFPVVGVGASAGGLEAFKQLVSAIPKDSGMAFVLVQHLDPNHESILNELLQKVTEIPVLEITDEIKVAPNHIYIIPSNKMLIANNGVLELSPRLNKIKSNKKLPIDLFFTSLAEVHQSHSIGVVLSGNASDGTQGLQAIKAQGGLTFAQDEHSAAYPAMPNSAISAGVVDFVLAPQAIPQKLLELMQPIQGISNNDTNDSDEAVFQQIIDLLRTWKGTDFTHYKHTTIYRRILRRMVLNNMGTPSTYLDFLNESKTERNLLYLDLLIPVTSFFRDSQVFEDLHKNIFPDIIKNKEGNENIRIWVAGCSTGEEVYSMAAIFYDLFEENGARNLVTKIQIFGTDINELVIAKARAATYSEKDVKDLNSKQRKRYFTKTKKGYQLIKEIREICVFAIHDFLKDPPFRRMDFLSCRNVLIYMEPFLQKKALFAFHYALNPEGCLLLGKSETIGLVPSLFASYKKSTKVFRRKEGTGRFTPSKSYSYERNGSPKNDWDYMQSNGSDYIKIANDIMLNRFTPASVIINEAMDILHFRGNTSKYLEPAAGNASFNVLKMAKQGLAFELQSMVQKAKKEKRTIARENVLLYDKVGEGNPLGFEAIDIELVPLPHILEPHYLLVFKESSIANEKPFLGPTTDNDQKQATEEKEIGKDKKDLQIAQLHQELMQLREDMRTIFEDQDFVNQELQISNEELLSNNEEMQTLNEEIETSKEELQSTNEELTIVNQETIGLNEQLTEAKEFAEAIVSTIHEPLIVLDKKFKVRSANKAFLDLFRIGGMGDIKGMPFFALDEGQWNVPDLRKLLEDVLFNTSRLENQEFSQNFSRIGKRTLLLNTSEIIRNGTEERLILVAMVDVTEKLKLQQKEQEYLESFKNLLQQAPVPIMVLKAPDFTVEVVNDSYINIVGKRKDFVGTLLFESLPELKAQGIQELLNKVVETALPYTGSEVPLYFDNGAARVNGFYNFVFQPLQKDDGQIAEIMVVANDVTEQVLSRKLVEETEARYHNMIYSSPSLIAIFKGKEMIIETANDAILKSWGKGNDVIGKPFFEVAPETVEQGFDKILLHVFTTGETYYAHEMSVILVRRGKPEQMYYTFIYHAQRDKNGEIDGVAIIANEVSEQVLLNKKLKESEAHFRLMADLMPAKISNADAQGKVIYCNQNWLGFTGLDFTKLMGLEYEKLIHPDDLDLFHKRFHKASHEGGNVEMEMRFLDKNGTYIWHLHRASPVKDNNGKIKLWVGVTANISEQIATRERNLSTYKAHSKGLEDLVAIRTNELQAVNESLLFKNEELMRMNMELEAFAYITSHDLQEPLRKISIFSGRILEKDDQQLSDKSKLYFKNIREAVDRMQRLIKDLFAFSHLSTSEQQFEKVDLKSIVDDVKKTLCEDIQEKQATIEVRTSAKIKVITFQFHQLVVNLISNSLKFSRPNVKPHLVIKTADFETGDAPFEGLLPNTRYCHISFSDNGIGFEKKYSERIFEVFQKLHGREQYSGTGIGLAIVKKIIDNHNGTITSKSEVDKGTTFEIYIPNN